MSAEICFAYFSFLSVKLKSRSRGESREDHSSWLPLRKREWLNTGGFYCVQKRINVQGVNVYCFGQKGESPAVLFLNYLTTRVCIIGRQERWGESDLLRHKPLLRWSLFVVTFFCSGDRLLSQIHLKEENLMVPPWHTLAILYLHLITDLLQRQTSRVAIRPILPSKLYYICHEKHLSSAHLCFS